MEVEEIIRKLRKARPEISREEFLKMVEERKKSLGNYFTDETIAKLVASEFGVKFSKKFFLFSAILFLIILILY